MRAYSKWLMLICLSVAACSDDKSSSSEEAASTADASTSDSDTHSSSAGKSGAGGKAAGGSGGSGKAATSSGDSKSASASGDDARSGDSKNDDGKQSDDQKSDSKGDAAESGSSDANGKSDQASVPTNGDQLSVCSRAEGDCNKGLACQAPATAASPGRGFCSKICESDDDCGGVSPDGTKYTCTTNNGTNTCEIVCSGTDDSSCPSGLSCVQTGRVRPAQPVRRAAGGEGGSGGAGGAGGSAAPQGEFRCRYPFEVSKLWSPCGDGAHVCDQDLTCQESWFGGVGQCTRSCEKDEDCAKPDSGNTKPTCRTLVPARGDTAAVMQCALSCADAKDDCPNGLACVEQRQPRVEPPRDGGMAEQPATVAWCL